MFQLSGQHSGICHSGREGAGSRAMSSGLCSRSCGTLIPACHLLGKSVWPTEGCVTFSDFGLLTIWICELGKHKYHLLQISAIYSDSSDNFVLVKTFCIHSKDQKYITWVIWKVIYNQKARK